LKNIGIASCDEAENLGGAVQCLSDVVTIFLDSRYAEIFDLEKSHFSTAEMCETLADLPKYEGHDLHRGVLKHVDADAVVILVFPADARRFEGFVYALETQMRGRLHELILPYFYQACYALPRQGTAKMRAQLTKNIV